MDLDDFRIPDTPRLERSMESLPAPRTAPASADIVGPGLNTQLASLKRLSAPGTRARELVVDTRSTSTVACDELLSTAPRRVPVSASKLRHRDKGAPRTSYFSALTQKFQQHDRNNQTRPFSSARTHTHPSGSQSAPRLSGEVVSYPNLAARNDRLESQSWESVHQVRNTQQSSHPQSGDVDAGFRGIQDAIATRFQDLEKRLQLQDQEITELRFSLNDANVTADVFEADKRQLKQKNEELERKLTQSDSAANKLRDETRKGKELRAAVEKQNELKKDAEKAKDRAARDHQALLGARKTTDEIRTQLDESRRELREATVLSIENNRQAEERADAKVQDLVQQLQRRNADVQALNDANERLDNKLDTIPERNFQALTTCVKKIIEKVADSRSEILADGEAVNKQHQEQHGAIVECLKGLLTASQQHVEALATSQQETEALSKQLLDKMKASDCSRKEAESSLRSEVTNGMCELQKCIENYQASFQDTFAVKIRESDILADLCQQREDDNNKISNQLLEQSRISREQLHEIRELHQALKELEEAPREDPKMIARISVLQEQTRHFEAELKEKEVLVTRLEESYKERTKSLISSSEKFASDIQQLNNTSHKREEEYRRAVDQASELAIKEARRASDNHKQETKKELQQERARRQTLEKELRQAKEDLSVTEEKSRRSEQSNEALQNELATAKLGNQAVTVHLEEKTRALEHRLDCDATLITQLKAALADKEMDYVNLRSSMEAYDEKVRILIEHLRGWAQDYTHIGTIRSRLEMLGQIDQSCAATARIREAEQIDNVLAQLRQYYARQNERDSKLDFGAGHSQAAPTSLYHSFDEDHEQRVSDLSAFLDAEVAGCQTAGDAVDGAERWSSAIQAAILGGATDSLKTPGNGPPEQSSDMKPPPVLKDRIINVALDPKSGMGPLSSPMILSPVPKRTRRETRSSAANNATMRNPVSPIGMKMTRRAKRKRPATVVNVDNAGKKAKKGNTETSVYFQGGEQGGEQGEASAIVISDGNKPAAAVMASSPPLPVKIEDS